MGREAAERRRRRRRSRGGSENLKERTPPLLTRFDLRIMLTGPIPYSATPQTGISAQLIFLSSGETGTGARPTPGDHSHRPPPTSAWDPKCITRNNSQTNHHKTTQPRPGADPIPPTTNNLHVSMHTSSPMLLQLCHYSTSTIACT